MKASTQREATTVPFWRSDTGTQQHSADWSGTLAGCSLLRVSETTRAAGPLMSPKNAKGPVGRRGRTISVSGKLEPGPGQLPARGPRLTNPSAAQPSLQDGDGRMGWVTSAVVVAPAATMETDQQRVLGSRYMCRAHADENALWECRIQHPDLHATGGFGYGLAALRHLGTVRSG